MKPLTIAAVMLLALSACAGHMLENASLKWDSWVGTTKDDRVRDLGIPARCHTFKSGGEICEWSMLWKGEVEMEENVSLLFDAKGIMCQWVYRGFYGERRSSSLCS
jgi:hypothetical protein